MKAKSLGELEAQVMEIIWKEQKCSVGEVQKSLSRKLAYTTVATMLQRLYDKGLVSRDQKHQVYTYSPKLSKESYSKNLARSFIDKFFASFGDVAVASFAETIGKLPPSKKKYLLKVLNDNIKAK